MRTGQPPRRAVIAAGPDHATLRAFATWKVHRELVARRAQAARPDVLGATMPKHWIASAIDLTAWLHQDALTLADLGQARLDAWLASGPAGRRSVSPFIKLASEHIVRGRIIAGFVTIGLTALVLMLAGSEAQSQTTPEATVAAPDNVQKSAALAAATPDIAILPPAAYVDPAAMRARAADMLQSIPFPKSRNSAAGYQWTGIEGAVSDPEIRNLLQFRASCDWFRDIADSPSMTDEQRAVVQQIPKWLVFRDTPFQATVEAVVASALAGDVEPMRDHVRRACFYKS